MEENKELEELLPQINVNVPATQDQTESNLVSDEYWLSTVAELMNNFRQDREEIADVKNTLLDMVMNGGDSTTSTKEALTKMFELQVDVSDKMTRVFDLVTRMRMKEKNTFPAYLNAKQENTFNITDGAKQAKRDLIRTINKKLKKQKEDNEQQNKS